MPETPPEVGSGGFRLGRDHELRALLGGGYGSSKSWMVELGAEYAYRDWAMKLGAYFQPTYDMALGDGELELMSIGGVAAACRRIGSRWRFVPCARVTLGMAECQRFRF